MVKKSILAVFATIIITALSGYLFYMADNSRNDTLEEVDFSTMKEVDIEVIETVKERMSAPEPSAQVTEQK